MTEESGWPGKASWVGANLGLMWVVAPGDTGEKAVWRVLKWVVSDLLSLRRPWSISGHVPGLAVETRTELGKSY